MPAALDGRDWAPTGPADWEPVLRGLRTKALDCLQTTLALLADLAHGGGAHLGLGRRCRFPARRPDGTVGVANSVPERTAEAAELLGLRVGPSEQLAGGPALRARVDRAGQQYVVADAHDLPWLPYAGHRHLPHSFLLVPAGGGYLVVDAYHNDTEWGPARPGVFRLTGAGLDRAVAGGATMLPVEPGTGGPPPADPAAGLAEHAARARRAGPEIEAYARTVRAGLPQPAVAEALVLDIWLLGRDRLLHAAWLGDHPAAAGAATRAAAWQQLAAQSYLALRRVQRGGPMNPAVLDETVRLLHADAAATAGAPDPAAAGPERVRGAVLDALGHTLHLDGETVRRAGPLRALPGFDSFRLVEVIDRVERRLGVRLAAEISAGDLRDVDGLCRLFAGAGLDRPGREPR